MYSCKGKGTRVTCNFRKIKVSPAEVCRLRSVLKRKSRWTVITLRKAVNCCFCHVHALRIAIQLKLWWNPPLQESQDCFETNVRARFRKEHVFHVNRRLLVTMKTVQNLRYIHVTLFVYLTRKSFIQTAIPAF